MSGVYSLINDSTIASAFVARPSSAVTLGVKFKSSRDGQVIGAKFYTETLAGSTHIASLWTSAGTLLASATFSNITTASWKWQYVYFNVPVPITANTLYVISYFSPDGSYTYGNTIFNSDLVSGDLTAPGGGVNGLYSYGAGNTFPASVSPTNASYFVDTLVTYFNDISSLALPRYKNFIGSDPTVVTDSTVGYNWLPNWNSASISGVTAYKIG